MTRRRLLLFGLLAALVVMGMGGWVFWPRTAITPENAAKIQKGMTLAEVEAIFGGAARDDATGEVKLAEGVVFLWGAHPKDSDGVQEWTSDHLWVWIGFNHENLVTSCFFRRAERVQASRFATLRRWLRL